MEYNNYRQVDKVVDSLFAEQKYKQAIELLDSAQQQFPNDLYEILWYKALIYAVSADYENCLTTLEEMIANEFFGKLDWGIFDPIRDDARFKAVFEADQLLKAKAHKNARMDYQVFTPAEYTSTQKHPLFFALHGDGESLDYFKYNWEPTAILNKGFIVVYVRSSQVICTNGFGWTPNFEITRKDVAAAYSEVVGQYAVDTDNIIIGGFSGGSIAALEITMANTLPVKGFISLCPSLKPDSFTKENVEKAARRGVRGVMMEGELQGTIAAQQEMLQVFQETGLPYQFYINPGIGHACPTDLPQKLSDAIEFILG